MGTNEQQSARLRAYNDKFQEWQERVERAGSFADIEAIGQYLDYGFEAPSDLDQKLYFKQDPDIQSIMMHGMIKSNYLKEMQSEPRLAIMTEHNMELFLSSSGYHRWFNTVSENILAIEKMNLFRDIHNPAKKKQMWNVALMNLESPFHGTREMMLTLIKHLIKDEQFMRRTVLPAVAKWSWLNRNKYHVLVILLGQYKLITIMQDLGINFDLLRPALELTLKYKHLFTGGQALIRMLHRDQEMQEFVYKLVVTVIENEPIQQLHNMSKYWFSSMAPKDYKNIYQMLELDDLDPTCMPIYLMGKKIFFVTHLFRREFQSHAHLNVLLWRLSEFADRPKLLPADSLVLLMETLVHHIMTCKNTDKIDKLHLTTKIMKYVLAVIEEPGYINVCNVSVTLFGKLLNHMANPTTQESDRRAQAMISQFMSYDMYDRYLLPTGAKELNYQPTITALRMFAAFVELFFEFTPSSRYILQPRPKESICWIDELLPASMGTAQLAGTFRTIVYGLEHLLRSDFDDVRTTALKMLYNKSVAYHFEPSLQATLANIFLSCDDEVIISSMNTLVGKHVTQLSAALASHKEDFYGTIIKEENCPNSQLYRVLDRCVETFFGFPEGSKVLYDIDLFETVVKMVPEVLDFALDSLNIAKDTMESQADSLIGSSFEVMDRSLQMLLDRSSSWTTSDASGADSASIAIAKRNILVVLWKTVRSAAVFAERYALWLLDRHVNRQGTVEALSMCLDIFYNIMLNCCHRGAIAVTAISLFRVVRRILLLKEEKLTVAKVVGNEPPEKFQATTAIVLMLEQFYHKCLALQHNERDFRRCRGFLFLVHFIISSEVDGSVSDSFLRFYLEQHVHLQEYIKIVIEGKECDINRNCKIGVLQLHQLNLLVREPLLNEKILPYIDDLLILALTKFRCPEWEIRNAALQLYSTCVTKLGGQRQQYDDADSHWPPVYSSFDEIVNKLPSSMQYILLQKESSDHSSQTSFLLQVLEFLSKLEYRGYCEKKHQTILHEYRVIIWDLLRHEHDAVRKLAAQCFAQLHDFHVEIPDMLENLVIMLFTTAGDMNFRQGFCQALHASVRKCATMERYLYSEAPSYVGNDWMLRIAKKSPIVHFVHKLVEQYYHLDTMYHPVGSYQYRCVLAQFLLYLGFDARGDAVLQLIFNRKAKNMQGLESFLLQMNSLYNYVSHGSKYQAVQGTPKPPSNNPCSTPYDIALDLGLEAEQDEKQYNND
ncbi:uncharacterized protein LOC128728391 [Anopheles nili]|uniref:uncharacterized protein LOC128728391 n=1 Tax=Anopheles nili TaxID=185578 RepID=UPI00237AC136|nr:uncharacterized protein LOC128728391 [Anopheles nili]